ncbi:MULTISPECIES: BCCT family transporter [Gordonia]|uniref:BCCT transporter n=1 Tax=Gordonia alkanivorans CGMCC 6845 TaxID=1423140 RepID=W9DLS8_9ACTN|nr:MULTISPECIES: BCCT family transporter [Gordonia]ETA08541.1 BCCT transporter [Gordonia alkanivorans CGMCC 6845]MDH3005203.1 BCCT family transporter [Gordonia alkanivorans]MDH3010500.1 BCCT family transporter [Gordonia alkanivorans]MDH3014615.1 BCCT family transporter [Gordonia alkanivorans]MDH3019292.1 BCCT family transporter [Gordonia alkanivorans]
MTSEQNVPSGRARDSSHGRGGGSRPARPRLDPVVFSVTALIVIAFVAWGLADKDGLNSTSADVLGWITTNLGWLFILSATGFVIFAVFLAVSKYGRIPLGRDDETPQFRTISWIAMMFSAGMGIGLMFFGAYEPLFHFVSPPPEIGAEDVRAAMATTMFHWGFHPWAMYAVVGLALAYSTFRLGRTQLISSVFERLFGPKVSNGPAGKVIDILAIFATLFGTVASLGLGALQIGSGLDKIGWVHEPTKLLLVGIIAILTAAFVASAVSGIARGIQWLSNINMVLAVVLAAFVFVVGPTIFILNLLPTTLGAYFTDLTTFAARSDATVASEAGQQWLSDWTIFYWAWWVSWTPFVGLFLAKISRGRTIREFVIGVMVVPTTVSLVWFCVFGGTAIREQMTGVLDFDAANDASEDTLFDVLANLPWAGVASALVMILVAIFFVSGADSASLVMGTLSQRGAEEPSRLITVFWGVLTGVVAALLLAISGDDALDGIKTMAIIAALPFVLVMIGMCLSLYSDLRHDPLIVSRTVLSARVDEHVREQAEAIATGELDSIHADAVRHLEIIEPEIVEQAGLNGDGTVPAAKKDGSPA